MFSETKYVLLNKDVPVLDFVCRRDEFDEPEFFELAWRSSLRPVGYQGLLPFLESRKAPEHRENMWELLEQYGCDDLEGFLRVTHTLSLNDTFWVRRAGEVLEWKDVSLYSNEFSEAVRDAALDGTVGPADPSAISPKFTTDGQFAKCWTREQGGIYLYKSGSERYEIEPVSEFLASQLASEICPASVSYRKAASPPTLVGPTLKGRGSASSEVSGMASAGTSPRSRRSIFPGTYAPSAGVLTTLRPSSMPETFFATLRAYSMQLLSPTTKGRHRS